MLESKAFSAAVKLPVKRPYGRADCTFLHGLSYANYTVLMLATCEGVDVCFIAG